MLNSINDLKNITTRDVDTVLSSLHYSILSSSEKVSDKVVGN